MLRAVQPSAQCCQNGLFVSSQQSLGVEPQAGKDGALAQSLRLRNDFLKFAIPQFPLDQALLAGNPCQVLTHAIVAIGPFLLMQIVGAGTAHDFHHQLGRA